jgi:hypothetical protein
MAMIAVAATVWLTGAAGFGAYIAAIDDKRKRLNVEKKRILLLRRIQLHAALRIQSTWRGYVVRLKQKRETQMRETQMRETQMREKQMREKQMRETQRFKNIAMLLMCVLVMLSPMAFWMKQNTRNQPPLT